MTSSRFYVAGGTLPTDAPSYVPRQADCDLLEGLLAGEFCYVLDTRQLGKSSLMVRTAARLREHGVRVLVLDLTAIGQNVTVDQWYDGLLNQMGRELGIEDELDCFVRSHPQLGPLQRFMAALQHVVTDGLGDTETRGHGDTANPSPRLRVPASPSPLVVFVDEIDAVRGLSFSTDEFFAGIRECYNLRARRPELKRLTFCLLGVATPASLVRNTEITPFNIGRRIDLHDFTESEAAPLANGLDGSLGVWESGRTGLAPTPAHSHTPRLLSRVLYWTGGHPYLTQRLCQGLVEAWGQSQSAASRAGSNGACPQPELVDRVCDVLFLSRQAREHDDNLLFVRDRIVHGETDVASVLDLYRQILDGRPVRSDDLRPCVTALLLSGIVRTEGGLLRVRNRIYERVFDRAWIHYHMPDAELRRQRAAYRRGVIRTAAIAGGILVVILVLVLTALRFARRAERNRDLAERNWKLADRHRILADRRTAEAQLLAHERGDALAQRDDALQREEAAVFAERDRAEAARQAAAAARSARGLADAKTAESRARLSRMYVERGMALADQGDALGALPWTLEALKVERGDRSRMRVQRIRLSLLLEAAPRLVGYWPGISTAAFTPDGRSMLARARDGHLWDLETGRPTTRPLRGFPAGAIPAVSPDGSKVAAILDRYTVRVWEARTGQPIAPRLRHRGFGEPQPGDLSGINGVFFSSDGHRLGTWGARSVCVWDLATGRMVVPPLDQGKHVNLAGFTRDGGRVLVACGTWYPSQDGAVYLWDLQRPTPSRTTLIANRDCGMAVSPDGSQALVVRYHRNDLAVAAYSLDTGAKVWETPLASVNYGVFWSPDGRRAVTLSGLDRTGTMRFWDVASGRIIREISASRAVSTATISPDNRRIACTSPDSTVRVFDAASGKHLGGPLPGDSASFGRDSRYLLVSVANDGTRLWDLAPREPGGLPIAPNGAASLTYSADGRWLLGVGTRTANVWNAASGRLVFRSPIAVSGAMFSPDGRLLILMDAANAVRAWETASWREIGPTLRHALKDARVRASPDGRTLLHAGTDGTVRVWDIRSGALRTPPIRCGGSVYQAAFTLDGNRFVTVTNQSVVTLWDVRTGRAVTTPRIIDRALWGIGFVPGSRDGRFLICGQQIYDLMSGRNVPFPPFENIRAPKSDGPGWAYAIDPQGRRIAVNHYNGRVTVWELGPPARLLSELWHDSDTTELEFSADGRLLQTISDGKPRLWDATTGEQVSPPMPLRLLFRPRSNGIAHQSSGTIIHLRSLPYCTLSISDLSALSLAMTGRKVVGGMAVGRASAPELRSAGAWWAQSTRRRTTDRNPVAELKRH